MSINELLSTVKPEPLTDDQHGWEQNMDQGSMDPHFGPGPWTTFMDRVHGPPFMDRAMDTFS